MAKRLEDVAEGIVRDAMEAVDDTLPKVGAWLRSALLWGWTFLGLLVIGGGLLFGASQVIGLAGAAVVVPWVVRGVRLRVARRRLERLARSSVVARAELDRLRIGRGMRATLAAFDLHDRRIAVLTRSPGVEELEAALKIEADLERAREHLYTLARAHARVGVELASLHRQRSVPAVQAARAELERELAGFEAQANAVALDGQRLADRLGAVRALISGDSADNDGRRTLADIVDDLERTVAAYREIDRDPIEDARERVQALRGKD